MTAVIIAVCVIGVFAVYLAILLPCLYEKGMLTRIHKLKKAKNGQVRVACVGDSITYGSYHVTNRNYPAVLSRWLDNGYCVNNYGYSSRTAHKNGDFPYTKEKLFRKSVEFDPEYAVIMFGTNDSKPYNWKGVEEYIGSLLAIVNSYNLPKSRVYLIAPPPVFQVDGKPVRYDIDADVIATQIRPAVKSICEEYGYNFIDMYAVFENKPDLFQDGVHPNADGAKLFAETVFKHLKQNLTKERFYE